MRRAVQTLFEEGPTAVASKATRHAGGHLRAATAARRLRSTETHSLDEAVDLAFSFSHRGIRIKPWQFRAEILELLRLLEGLRPRVTLEIGTCSGGTLFLFSRISAPDATLISVDLPGGRFGGGHSRWLDPLLRSFGRADQRIELVLGDSHEARTLAQIERKLAGATVDFLFIDGDHTYDGVKADFEMYSPLVRSEGLIALHDIVPGNEDQVGGVPTFWRELKSRYKTREIVENWSQGSAGIGVLLSRSAASAAAPRR